MLRLSRNSNREVIAGYRLLEVIGHGGAGTVHKAVHLATGHAVAVKLAPSDVVNDSVLRMRFAQECKVSSQINHPHIVRVLEFGLEDNMAYMVMELVEGESLDARLERDGRLPEAEALRLIRQIGAALQWAHERQLIHRDIKPGNILIAANGDAKLADLGIARNLASDIRLTQTRSSLGTPNFMAPEQFEDARHATVRSDIYSLAATLYQMTTGELPFRARSAAAVLAIYTQQTKNDLTPPRRITQDLSVHVDAAILRAMRADPAERFASVAEFLAALDAPAAPVTVAVAQAPKPRTPSGREARGKRRFSCRRTIACRVLQRELEDGWPGQVVNLSESGLCLRLPRRFEPGTLLALAMENSAQQRRSIVVRIMWVKHLARNAWQMGCRYDSPLGEREVQELRLV
jgi:serine/threonine protein kinase